MIPVRIGTLLLSLVTLAFPVCAQSYFSEGNFPVLEGPYLGQKPPGRIPEIFAPGIVSAEPYSEFVCMFTPGAMECIFDRYGDDKYQRGAVFITRVEDGKWIKPELHPFFTTLGEVFLPTIAPDGNTWFFTSHSLPVPEGAAGILPMFYIKKTKTGWSQPEYFAEGIHASATLDGTVYIRSGREIIPQAEFKEIVDLAEAVPFDVGHAVTAPDGSYFIFDNQELPRKGNCKLFVSFITSAGTWSNPISLGKYIKQHAFCAWITYDGKYLFFHSLDDSKGNIYWVSAEIIEDLRPKELR